MWDLDLTGGTLVVAGNPGQRESITTFNGELLTGGEYPFDDYELYPDLAALVANAPSGSVPNPLWLTRFHVDGNTLYGTSHSTDEVMTHAVATGALLSRIPLQNFDTWVRGIGVAGGYLHLIDGGGGLPNQTEPRIARFDMGGQNVSNVTVVGHAWSHNPTGLWCDAP